MKTFKKSLITIVVIILVLFLQFFSQELLLFLQNLPNQDKGLLVPNGFLHSGAFSFLLIFIFGIAFLFWLIFIIKKIYNKLNFKKIIILFFAFIFSFAFILIPLNLFFSQAVFSPDKILLKSLFSTKSIDIKNISEMNFKKFKGTFSSCETINLTLKNGEKIEINIPYLWKTKVLDNLNRIKKKQIIKETSCLTVENFDLVKNFILENGEKIKDKNYPTDQDVYLFEDESLSIRYRVINENFEQILSGFDIGKENGKIFITTKDFANKEKVDENYKKMLNEFCQALENIRSISKEKPKKTISYENLSSHIESQTEIIKEVTFSQNGENFTLEKNLEKKINDNFFYTLEGKIGPLGYQFISMLVCYQDGKNEVWDEGEEGTKIFELEIYKDKYLLANKELVDSFSHEDFGTILNVFSKKKADFLNYSQKGKDIISFNKFRFSINHSGFDADKKLYFYETKNADNKIFLGEFENKEKSPNLIWIDVNSLVKNLEDDKKIYFSIDEKEYVFDLTSKKLMMNFFADILIPLF